SQRVGLHAVSFFPGPGPVIPTAVFDAVGYFGERLFPHYGGEYDYTILARRQGRRTFCNYDAPLFIYPDASGDFMNRQRRTLTGFYNHLFGIKGGGNLINYSRFVVRNCPRPFVMRALFLGYMRRIGGYWLRKQRPRVP